MRPLACLALFALGALALAQDSQRYVELYREGSDATEPEVAVVKLRAALDIYDQDGDVWNEYGRHLYRLKRYPEAVNAFRNALRYGGFGNKFRAGAHYAIARSLAQSGDVKGAWVELEAALKAGHRSIEAVRRDKDLIPLHADPRWVQVCAAKDTSKMDRVEGWRYDLWFLNREVQRIHFNPYVYFTAKQHDDYVRKLSRDIPRMTDDQVRVALMKYMARMGDGHTGIRMFPPARQPKVLPLQFFQFADGLYVTSASPEHASLAGAKVLSVGGRPMAEVMRLASETAGLDNETSALARLPRVLVNTHALAGLGLSADPESATLEVEGSDGVRRKVVVPASHTGAEPGAGWVSARDQGPDPRYLKERSKAYWFEPVPELGAVYCQYNAVRADPKESPPQFASRLLAYIEANDVKRLILDVRWNGGGNSFLNTSLVNGIVGSKRLNQDDALFIITGRNTYSAAQNFVTDLGRAAKPVFVGEPTGSQPNFVGETVMIELPYSKMQASVSDLYWQRSWPMDARKWIAPDLPALPRFTLYKQNRDPAMEAIAAYVAKLPQGS